MTGEELNILSKIKVRPVEEQRDYLLEQNMLLTGKIATLKKENAELKEEKGCETCTKFDEVKLTKAKEIIELFVQWNYGCCKIPDYKDIVKQAEQFLKEIEK